LAALLILFSFGAIADTGLTEGNVRKILGLVEQAVISHDAEKLMSHFSDDAKIVLELPENMGGKVEFDVDSYKSMLKQSWAMPAKFTYEVRDIKINIDPKGDRATVSDVTLETIEMNGQIIASSKAVENIEIINKNGKPLITSIFGKVDIEM